MTKKKTEKQTELINVNSEKVLAEVQTKTDKVTVNGLYLPELENKENSVSKSVYLKESLYTKLYKISKELNVSINVIHVSLLEQFVNANTHLLKK